MSNQIYNLNGTDPHNDNQLLKTCHSKWPCLTIDQTNWSLCGLASITLLTLHLLNCTYELLPIMSIIE